MFWNRKKSAGGELSLPGPKDLPQLVGAYLVVQERKDPDWVWKLKGVIRPTEKKKAFYCRVFSEADTIQAGIKVKDWTSLEKHQHLIIWEGYCDRETNTVRTEKYAKPAISSN